MRRTLSIALLVAMTGCSNQPEAADPDATEPPGASASLYSVDVYDPTRDASADLVATIAQASAESKRILLEVGGLW